ncbi:malonyl-[acyl-carrier protein] O-methyltransferase BioC, partial [Mannheimia haemolytica]
MDRIDKGRIKQRFSAAVSNYDQQARAQQQIHQRLLSLLSY